MNDERLMSNLWFTARWATGYLLDLAITIGGAAAMVWSLFFYLRYPLTGLPLIPDGFLASPIIAFGVSLGVFSAFMAGRQWVRTQYFTHILPEVWNETVQNFVQSAKEQEEKEKKEGK